MKSREMLQQVIRKSNNDGLMREDCRTTMVAGNTYLMHAPPTGHPVGRLVRLASRHGWFFEIGLYRRQQQDVG
jgi:hypothetical protein